MNNGEPTFISSSHGSISWIDLTIVSKNLASKLHWSIDDDTHGSDHYPISVYSEQQMTNSKLRKRWLYKNADWSRFEETIEQSLGRELDKEHSIDEISNIIINSAKSSIPQTSDRTPKKAELWWSDEVKTAVKTRRKALRKLKRTHLADPNREDLRKEFLQARSAARKTINAAKRESWDNFCSSFSPHTPSDILWSNFNKLCGKRKLGTRGLVIDGKFEQDPVIIAEHFADHFQRTSACDTVEETPEVSNTSLTQESINTDLDHNFSYQELLRAIDSTKGFSTGNGNVGYPMIHHCR